MDIYHGHIIYYLLFMKIYYFLELERSSLERTFLGGAACGLRNGTPVWASCQERVKNRWSPLFDLILHFVHTGADVFICQVVAVDSALCWHRAITRPRNDVSVKQSSWVSSESSYQPPQMSADIKHLWSESEQCRICWPYSSSAEPPALGTAPGSALWLPFAASYRLTFRNKQKAQALRSRQTPPHNFPC